MFKVYMTASEILDNDKSIVAKITTFDEVSAAVEIDTLFTVASWQELSDKVLDVLKAMELNDE